MEMNEIRTLAQIMKDNGLTRVEIQEEGKSIRMERESAVCAPAVTPVLSAPVIQSPLVPAAEEVKIPAPQEPEGRIVESPIVGMYYASPAPGDPPFVKKGSQVKKGDVLCIVEAMKTMNEITSDCDGEILEIYAGNGQLVEVGQRLFLVREAQ